MCEIVSILCKVYILMNHSSASIHVFFTMRAQRPMVPITRLFDFSRIGELWLILEGLVGFITICRSWLLIDIWQIISPFDKSSPRSRLVVVGGGIFHYFYHHLSWYDRLDEGTHVGWCSELFYFRFWERSEHRLFCFMGTCPNTPFMSLCPWNRNTVPRLHTWMCTHVLTNSFRFKGYFGVSWTCVAQIRCTSDEFLHI